MKGHCKYSMKERLKRRGKEREGEDEGTREKKEAGSSLLFFSPSLLPSFLSLPLFSNVCSWAVSVNLWLSYTHIQLHYITHTLQYLLSFCNPLCVCMTAWFRRRPVMLSKELILLVFTTWWQRKVLFEMIYSRHWSYLGSGVFISHRMNCIAFLPTDHISSHIDNVLL